MIALRPYLALIGAVVAVALLAAAYIAGRRDGRAIADGKQAAVDRAVKAESDKREAVVATGETAGAAKESDRQEKVREVYRETNTVTERPVYRNICIDGDGLRLIERATAIANGDDPGEPARPAGDPPQPRRSADGGQDGAAALGSQLDVLDVAGGIRGQLVRLQCAVLASAGQPLRGDCPR